MENFIQHAVRGLCICSLLWNVVHTLDFEDFEERHKKAREEFDNFDRSFSTLRVVVPLVMGLLFVAFCVLFCCIAYRRRQRFWEMHQQQQQQQRHMVAPVAPILGPGPVTSGTVGNYGTPTWNGISPAPCSIMPSVPAPYQPQPVGGAYPWSGPYASVNDAPSTQPLGAAATPWPCAPPPPPYSSDTKQLI